MHPFTLERPADLATALALRAQAGRNDAPAEYIAGGTDMVQLLQENVRRPERLVSLAGLLDDRIEVGQQGLRLGEVRLRQAQQRLHAGVERRDERPVDQPGLRVGIGQRGHAVGQDDRHPLRAVGDVADRIGAHRMDHEQLRGARRLIRGGRKQDATTRCNQRK